MPNRFEVVRAGYLLTYVYTIRDDCAKFPCLKLETQFKMAQNYLQNASLLKNHNLYTKMSRAASTRRRSSRGEGKQRASMDEEEGDEIDEMEDIGGVRGRNKSSSSSASRRVSDESEKPSCVKKSTDLHFTQQAPEMSQLPQQPKANEIEKLEQLNEDLQDQLIMDLSRMLLFKGLSGEPIDRLKIIKEALGDRIDPHKSHVSNALFSKANERISQTFGFELSRAPHYMEMDKYLPCSKTKIKDRFYLVNRVADDEDGSHSKTINMIHLDNAVERGVLMVILAFIYCKGELIKEGKTRWLTAEALYKLLHSLDENIPASPPVKSTVWESNMDLVVGTLSTPNIDALLQKFIYFDYLLKIKVDENANLSSVTQTQGDNASHVAYAMGPRAALEVGRRQVLFFCAEILDEQPDPTMLAELDAEENEDGEDDDNHD